MKTLKEIKKDYNPDDRKVMKEGLKYLKVFDYDTNKKVNKSELKKIDAEEFWSGVYRATFHASAVREFNGKIYFFANNYCFI